jgi:hypothetical protein
VLPKQKKEKRSSAATAATAKKEERRISTIFTNRCRWEFKNNQYLLHVLNQVFNFQLLNVTLVIMNKTHGFYNFNNFKLI